MYPTPDDNRVFTLTGLQETKITPIKKKMGAMNAESRFPHIIAPNVCLCGSHTNLQ